MLDVYFYLHNINIPMHNKTNDATKRTAPV